MPRWIFVVKMVIVSAFAVAACVAQGSSDSTTTNGDDTSDASAGGACPYDTTKNRWHCGAGDHEGRPGEVCSNSE